MDSKVIKLEQRIEDKENSAALSDESDEERDEADEKQNDGCEEDKKEANSSGEADNTYGSNNDHTNKYIVHKEKCINHVKKRILTHLLKSKKQWQGYDEVSTPTRSTLPTLKKINAAKQDYVAAATKSNTLERLLVKSRRSCTYDN
ncbi:unnamed protein product [Didymodactylos carnosus]|uniref:Uncharacterized protein n=1 Tax=Didymodactylos carnosus TaxID=1234261 RepID=A0A814EGV5_9BILA|nr:unnamed protein product [Didymodactylos carnosus]CAF3742329.1 unnamed protein product [Didymodactylos carnosus]